MDLCRRVIRQNINKERIERGKIAELNLPKTIIDYLEYKDRLPAQPIQPALPVVAAAAAKWIKPMDKCVLSSSQSKFQNKICPAEASLEEFNVNFQSCRFIFETWRQKKAKFT